MVDYTMQPIRVQPLDIGHTLGTIAQLEGVQQRNRLLDMQTQEATRKVEGQNRLRTLLGSGQPIDDNTIAQAMAIDPEVGSRLQTQHANADKAKREKALKDLETTGNLLNFVKSAPEQSRPQAYAMARQRAGELGLDVAKVPEQYDPMWIDSTIAAVTDIKTQIQQAEGKRPITASAGAQILSPDGRTVLHTVPKEGGGGPFGGTGMDAQALNIVASYQQKKAANQPTTQQEDFVYSLAARHLESSRVVGTPETGFTEVRQPPLPAYPGAAAPAAAPAAAAPAPAAPGQGAPPAAPAAAQGQSTVTRLTDPGVGKKELSDLKTARGEAASIVSALEDFRSTRKSAGTGERVKSAVGMSTPLNTSYNVAALVAKGEALFQLGVLNGPDLDIIRRALPDPATPSGAVANSKDVDAAIDKIVNLIQTKISAKEQQLNIPAAERTNIRTMSRSLASAGGASEDPLGIR